MFVDIFPVPAYFNYFTEIHAYPLVDAFFFSLFI